VVYLEPLKTTVAGKHADAILTNTTLRSRFICPLPCCRFRGVEELPDRARLHYLHARHSEVVGLRAVPGIQPRIHRVETALVDAQQTALAVRRVLGNGVSGLPDFGHLDRWIALLAREKSQAAVA